MFMWNFLYRKKIHLKQNASSAISKGFSIVFDFSPGVPTVEGKDKGQKPIQFFH